MDKEQIARYNAAQAKNFDHSYDRFLVALPTDVMERMERIVAAPAISDGETVLDVGTGTGALIPLIQRYRPKQVIVCDLSQKMLEQVKRRFPNVVCHQCDVRDLVLPDRSIDIVFMNAMFGNIADKEGSLANLVRMLGPSGRIVISHPEGRAFVAGIVRAEPFPITPLPSEAEAVALFGAFGLSLRRYVELVLSGGLPTTPTASVEPLQLRAGVGWQARAMGTASASRAQTFVSEAVLEYVDRFVADYRVANSR